MSNVQYTIRSVPKKLDSFLRRQASLQGKSLNQTVLDYIQQATKLDLEASDENFEWLVGANTMDEDTLQAISELKVADKSQSRI